MIDYLLNELNVFQSDRDFIDVGNDLLPPHLPQSETFVPPLDLHLQQRTKSYQNRLANSDALQHRELLCSWIRRRTKRRAPRGTQPQGSQMATEIDLHGYWVNRWEEKQSRTASSRWDAVVGPPDERVLLLHKHLRKAESFTPFMY